MEIWQLSRDYLRVFSLLFLGILCAILPGCASRPVAPLEAGFVAQGKLSVRPLPGVVAVQAFSATFRWQQTQDDYRIDLWGPLGQGHTQLAGNPASLTLRDARGREVHSTEPERLMRQELGWSLPLAAVPNWLQGALAPGYRASGVERDADGALSVAQQLGWALVFERYREVDGAGRLPGRVKGENDTLRVTIAVRDWQVAQLTPQTAPIQ